MLLKLPLIEAAFLVSRMRQVVTVNFDAILLAVAPVDDCSGCGGWSGGGREWALCAFWSSTVVMHLEL